MVFAQVERLKNDSNELNIYAKKLEKKGKTEQAKKIYAKLNFVQKTLRELELNPT